MKVALEDDELRCVVYAAKRIYGSHNDSIFNSRSGLSGCAQPDKSPLLYYLLRIASALPTTYSTKLLFCFRYPKKYILSRTLPPLAESHSREYPRQIFAAAIDGRGHRSCQAWWKCFSEAIPTRSL